MLSSEESESLKVLVKMHEYARPHGGEAVEAFAREYIDRLPGVSVDAAGNRSAVVRLPDGRMPSVLWSSHLDTVHKVDGRVRVVVRGSRLYSATPWAGCLGADCTVGVWLAREMFLAGVPGLYIWHAGEELGCLGSGFISLREPDRLRGITRAIAFDRRGRDSIITHQLGERTASDAFAFALAGALARAGLPGYRPDSTGSFTDTVEYADLVPECSNISVGYYQAHSQGEWLDLKHVVRLRRAMLRLDMDAVPASRTPRERFFLRPLSRRFCV